MTGLMYHAGGRAIYMAGSPQGDVTMNERTIICSQANNM